MSSDCGKRVVTACECVKKPNPQMSVAEKWAGKGFKFCILGPPLEQTLLKVKFPVSLPLRGTHGVIVCTFACWETSGGWKQDRDLRDNVASDV